MSSPIRNIKKSDYQLILESAFRRNIKLLHYTPLKNLSSIMTNGLLSRKQMNLRSIKPVLYHGWGKKWYELDDYICLCLAPPKNMINKTKEYQIALMISSEVLGYEKTCFSPFNSASDTIDTQDIFASDNIDAFDNMFKYAEGNKLKNNLAEILVKDYIAVRDIKGIFLPDWNIAYRWIFPYRIKGLFGLAPQIKLAPDLF